MKLGMMQGPYLRSSNLWNQNLNSGLPAQKWGVLHSAMHPLSNEVREVKQSWGPHCTLRCV